MIKKAYADTPSGQIHYYCGGPPVKSCTMMGATLLTEEQAIPFREEFSGSTGPSHSSTYLQPGRSTQTCTRCGRFLEADRSLAGISLHQHMS